jgi:hypothetical protein
MRLDDEAANRLEALYTFIDAIKPSSDVMLVANRDTLRRLARSHVMLLCLGEMRRDAAPCAPPLLSRCPDMARMSRRAEYALRFRGE